MDLADLARWTPVRVDFSGPDPAVDWADLSQERFTEPFFDQTAARWASGPRASPLVRTGLDALIALDQQPSLEPAGIIFHLSRCGSTLVSRLLGTIPGVLVLGEPSPLNAVLGLEPGRVDQALLVQIVRLVVRALGRRRHGDEQRLVLKCTSWNVRCQALLTAAFPETPWIWVQRDPALVLASLLAEPPGWLRLKNWPAHAEQRFGLDPATVPTMTQAIFAAQALGSMLEAATAADPSRRLCVDHAELPDAAWQRVAPHFGLEVDASAIQHMADEARFYSKAAVPQNFSGDNPKHRRVTEEIREAAEQFVQPGYRRLAVHR